MELLLNRKVQKVYSEINIPKKSKILANLLRISVPAALETFLIMLSVWLTRLWSAESVPMLWRLFRLLNNRFIFQLHQSVSAPVSPQS